MIKNFLTPIILVGTIFLLTACSPGKIEETKANKSSKETSSSETMKKEKADTDFIYKETKGKNVTYYTMKPDPIFGATATLIEKDGKGLLVDTQFSTDDADKIIQVAKDKKMTIEFIYLSYSDPDYYFGTQRIKEAFPNAKVMATESNVKRIEDTNQAKLAVWAETLQDKAPESIIIPEVVQDSFELAGEKFEIYGTDAVKQTLYNETDELLLGGILVSTDSHLFMADTKTIASQEQWITDLDELARLQAKTVIPGHFADGNEFAPDNIEFTKNYLRAFIEVETNSQTSGEIIEKMQQAYPNLPMGSLEMSAKVVTGEQPWE